MPVCIADFSLRHTPGAYLPSSGKLQLFATPYRNQRVYLQVFATDDFAFQAPAIAANLSLPLGHTAREHLRRLAVEGGGSPSGETPSDQAALLASPPRRPQKHPATDHLLFVTALAGARATGEIAIRLVDSGGDLSSAAVQRNAESSFPLRVSLELGEGRLPPLFKAMQLPGSAENSSNDAQSHKAAGGFRRCQYFLDLDVAAGGSTAALVSLVLLPRPTER